MIKIFSDSTCDLSKELIERYNITILPLHIILGNDEFLDGVNVSPDDIYTWSDANKTTPKTSAISLADTVESFRPVIENGDEIICFTISESMSTTANVCRLAADELDASDKISVINSKSLSTGIGLQVIEACVKASEGMDRASIVSYIESIQGRVSASFVVDTLTYLHRGGRCSGVAALAGSMLKLHPEIDLVDGKMLPGKKFRGTHARVVMEYVKGQEETLLKAKKDRIFVTHAGHSEDFLDDVKEYLRSLGYFDEILETQAGGVISSHCGPRCIGILYIKGE